MDIAAATAEQRRGDQGTGTDACMQLASLNDLQPACRHCKLSSVLTQTSTVIHTLF